MRTSLKVVVPLIVSVAFVSLLFAAYQVRTERRVLRNDLSRRAEILAESLQETIEPLFDRGADKNMQRLVERFGQREHLKGIAVYDAEGSALAITSGLPPNFRTRPAAAARAVQLKSGSGEFLRVSDAPLRVFALPLHRDGEMAGTLVVFRSEEHTSELQSPCNLVC